MEIGAAYIRVSTNDQMEYSPDSQLQMISSYAKAHEIILPEEFIFREQDGVSGRKADNRPEFQRMIATARKPTHPISVILVWKFSRFARNQEESIVYKSLLKKESNVRVVSVSEPLIEGEFGTLIERIIEWMDGYYSTRLSGEVKRGMSEKVNRGEPVTIPSFGYDIVDKKYIVNNETAPIVKMIFSNFITGMGTREIALKLNDMGIRTRRGSMWENRTIEYLLRNPVYIGKIRWNPTGKTSTRSYNDPNVIIKDGDHEPIIDMNVWEKTQARLDEIKKMYSRYVRKTMPETMLQGLVKCSTCGSSLSRINPTGFQCSAYAKGACNVSHYISIPKLEKMVLNAIKEQFKAKNIVNITIRGEQSDDESSRLIEKQIQKEQLKLIRVKEAYEAGVDSLSEYKDNKMKINDHIKELRASVPKLNENELKRAFWGKYKSRINILFSETQPIDSRIELLRSIIDKIVFDRASCKVDIFYKY